MNSDKVRRRAVVAVLLGSAVTVAGVASYAAIPGSSPTVDGCYVTRSGSLRVIDKGAGETCRSGETAISWNQQGPQGPQGVAGPQGPEGPEGPAGAQGETGKPHVYVTHASEMVRKADPNNIRDSSDFLSISLSDLPPGSYLAELHIGISGNVHTISCILNTPTATLVDRELTAAFSHNNRFFVGSYPVDSPVYGGYFDIPTAFTAAATTSLSLWCRAVDPVSQVSTVDADLVVTEVAAVN